MANSYVCETVNVVDNNFSADSRDKNGRRVVMFDEKRTMEVFLFPPHILQIEAVVDSDGGVDRGVISMSSGLRYITARGAAVICRDIAKLA
jgi:hypothetical protein